MFYLFFSRFKMASIKIKFMLHILDEDSLETNIIPLPRNDNIFTIFKGRRQRIHLVDKDGKAMPYHCFYYCGR